MWKQFSGLVILALFFAGICPFSAQAQRPFDSTHLDSLKVYEQKLQQIGDSMVDADRQAMRVHSLKQYIPTLVETLKIPGSFEYPFDSLRYMFTFTPPDRSFRLYNWHINFIDQTYRFYGVIQMNNKDSLELYPLFDRVEEGLINAEDTVLSREGWYGAQYYKLIQKTIDDKKYYFLLGWDGFNRTCNRKLIDVLHFNEEGKPQFGAPFFKHEGTTKKRIVFIFNNKATMELEYDPGNDVIAFDHLVPPNKRSEGHEHTYIPDGTYEYFVFDKKQNIWQHKDQYFDRAFTPAEDSENAE